MRYSSPAGLRILFLVPLRHFFTRLSGDRDASLFLRVFVLSMAALLLVQVPTVLLQQLDQLSKFHPRPLLHAK
jgi:hypothetical protein